MDFEANGITLLTICGHNYGRKFQGLSEYLNRFSIAFTVHLLQAQTFNPFFKQKWTFLVRTTLVWALICSFNTSNVSNPYPFTLLPGLTAICAIMSCPEYIFGHFQYFSIEILEFGQNKSLFWPLPVAGSEILFFQNITSFFKKHLQKTACQKLFPFSG